MNLKELGERSRASSEEIVILLFFNYYFASVNLNMLGFIQGH